MGKYVELGAVKTWYDEHGEGDPLVLVHGGMADDTIAFLETVVGEPADYVGHSVGAFVGLLVAMQRPDLIKRLVLISSGFNKSGEAVPDAEWNVDQIVEFLGPAYGEVSPDGVDHFRVVATKVGEMAHPGEAAAGQLVGARLPHQGAGRHRRADSAGPGPDPPWMTATAATRPTPWPWRARRSRRP